MHYYSINTEDDSKLRLLFCLEQIRTIDGSRLDSYIGHLFKRILTQLDEAILISLGFNDRMCLYNIMKIIKRKNNL